MARTATTAIAYKELPVASGNYDTTRGIINQITIHTMVGTVAGAAARFNTANQQASAHYGVGYDGKLYHWLEEYWTAYHAGNYGVNQTSIGIEHEDMGNYNSPRPDALYATAGKLVKDICAYYNIPIDRAHIKGHNQVSQLGTACPDSLDIDRIISEAKGSVPVTINYKQAAIETKPYVFNSLNVTSIYTRMTEIGNRYRKYGVLPSAMVLRATKPTISDCFIGNYGVTQGFGENPGSYAQFGMKGHNGMDFGVPSGKQVIAATQGKIVKASYDAGGYGNYIEVWDDIQNCVTLYAHLKSFSVSIGQRVVRGQLLGLSNNTGNSTGPHLHFAFGLTNSSGVRLNQNNGFYGWLNPNLYATWNILNPTSPVVPGSVTPEYQKATTESAKYVFNTAKITSIYTRMSEIGKIYRKYNI